MSQPAEAPAQAGKAVWVATLIASLVSLVASFVLSVDAITLASNPTADLSCNINSVISCGTVGRSWQAHVFGFPNAFLGLMFEPIIITVAVAHLGGVRFPRWFMLLVQGIYTIGFAFAYWLFYQAMFNIHALCPWCLTVTVATTLVFFELFHVNVLNGALPMPAKVRAWVEAGVRNRVDLFLLIVWLLVLVLLVMVHYGAALFA